MQRKSGFGMFKFLTIFTMLATIIVKLNTNLNFKRMLQSFSVKVLEDLILKGWNKEEGFKSQSLRMQELKPIRFVQTEDNRVYWMQDGELYFAHVSSPDVEQNIEGTKVELTELSEDEVKELLLIMDALRR